MKLTALAGKLLLHMVRAYSENRTEVFQVDTFKELYPDQDEKFISAALYALENDGFVKIMGADNVAYTASILPKAIQQADENTLIKKGYKIAKEIRSWL